MVMQSPLSKAFVTNRWFDALANRNISEKDIGRVVKSAGAASEQKAPMNYPETLR